MARKKVSPCQFTHALRQRRKELLAMPPYLGSWETDIVGSIIYADAISLSYMKDRGYGCDEASAKPWLKKPSTWGAQWDVLRFPE